MKFIKIYKNMLKESPDEFYHYDNDRKLIANKDCDTSDARPFFYLGDQLFTVDKKGVTHGELAALSSEIINTIPAEVSQNNEGRIWLDSKYISFWSYPKNNSEMKKVINDLEKFFNIKIWDNKEWNLEVIDYLRGNEEFVHPSEFKKSKDVPESERVDHDLSPMLKKFRGVKGKFGSERKPIGTKKGEVPAQTHARMRQESLNEIIKKSGDKWILYSTSGKKLGTHKTKKGALSQEAAIHARKVAKYKKSRKTKKSKKKK